MTIPKDQQLIIRNYSNLSDFDALGLVRSVIGASADGSYHGAEFVIQGIRYKIDVATSGQTSSFYLNRL